jgi:hypothetical protein
MKNLWMMCGPDRDLNKIIWNKTDSLQRSQSPSEGNVFCGVIMILVLQSSVQILKALRSRSALERLPEPGTFPISSFQ